MPDDAPDGKRFDLFAYAAALRGSTLPAVARHLALHLAVRARPDGTWNDTGDALAADTGLSRRAIVNALATLEADGWIERRRRHGRNGRRLATEFRLPSMRTWCT